MLFVQSVESGQENQQMVRASGQGRALPLRGRAMRVTYARLGSVMMRTCVQRLIERTFTRAETSLVEGP